MRIKLFLFGLLTGSAAYAQTPIIAEAALAKAIRASSDLPATIIEAHAQGAAIKGRLDSLDQSITASFQALAEKMQKRSARLNSAAGFSADGETLSIIPFNPQFSDYFRSEWKKMDALEKAFSQTVQAFYGKELYKTQGYIPAWDSVYAVRRPAMTRYRDGVIQLVKAEITYLKANAKMGQSSNEAERMQYFEEHLSVLQKLALLRDRLRRVVVDDGIEKVAFCKSNPQACGSK